jgi:hypothetical protein
MFNCVECSITCAETERSDKKNTCDLCANESADIIEATSRFLDDEASRHWTKLRERQNEH